MILQTEVNIKHCQPCVNYAKRGLILGSCFAYEIGNHFEKLGFNICNNPVGVLYNPISVAQTIDDIYTRRQFTESDLFQLDSLWHSFSHHGSFSNSDKDETLKRINSHIDNDFDYIIVTLGTAWVFEHQGQVVANCHKVPTKEFIRRRLSVSETIIALENIANTYPKAKIVFTISPIRHLKDGLEDNSLSKATLRCAVGDICERFKNCFYFPAYEIVNDQLRDYRFYKEDMIHVSQQTVNYIVERFADAFFDNKTNMYVKEIETTIKDFQHRPLHSDSDAYAKFVQQRDQKLAKLLLKYNHLDTKIISKFATI